MNFCFYPIKLKLNFMKNVNVHVKSCHKYPSPYFHERPVVGWNYLSSTSSGCKIHFPVCILTIGVLSISLCREESQTKMRRPTEKSKTSILLVNRAIEKVQYQVWQKLQPVRGNCHCFCLVTKFCLTLCDPKDYSRSGSSAHGISQARILEWLLFPSAGNLPDPGIKLVSPALAGRFFTIKSWAIKVASRSS